MLSLGHKVKSLIFSNKPMPYVFTHQRCSDCGSRVILWRHPSRWAGIFECLNEDCAASWSCEHPNTHEEMVEPWPTGPEDNPVAAPVYVCDDCDVTVEDRDPVLDRLEAAYD
jgi:hypothetical protein